MNAEERFKRLFEASPEQLGAIDNILEGKIQKPPPQTVGPLLMGMKASAKFLGVSRTTIWRLVGQGRLQKVEVLPGSFWLRRTELEAIANGG
jgi:hypothetical protein